MSRCGPCMPLQETQRRMPFCSSWSSLAWAGQLRWTSSQSLVGMLRKPWPICTTDLSLFLESTCVSPPCGCGLAMHSCHRGRLSAECAAHCFGASRCTGPAFLGRAQTALAKCVAMSMPPCSANATLLIIEVKCLCLSATMDLLGEFGDAKTAFASLHQ